jgi:hypothetical protein
MEVGILILFQEWTLVFLTHFYQFLPSLGEILFLRLSFNVNNITLFTDYFKLVMAWGFFLL